MFHKTVGIVLSLALSVSVEADEDELRAGSRAVTSFVARLQLAIEQHDSRTVAALFRFPVTVLVAGWRIPIANEESFLRLYDQLFTPQLQCLIEQHPNVQVAGEGISLGDGAIWAQMRQGQLKIERLIVPSSSVPRRGRQPSRKVIFTDPRYPANYSGTLVQDDVDSYVVAARKGQVLRARIDGFRGREAVLRGGKARDVPSARSDGANDRATRMWSERASEHTEFRLDVVRLAPYCGPAVTYVLAITLE